MANRCKKCRGINIQRVITFNEKLVKSDNIYRNDVNDKIKIKIIKHMPKRNFNIY